jgi:hypothetical protein
MVVFALQYCICIYKQTSIQDDAVFGVWNPMNNLQGNFDVMIGFSTTRLVGMLIFKGSLDTIIGTYIQGNCQYYWASEH